MEQSWGILSWYVFRLILHSHSALPILPSRGSIRSTWLGERGFLFSPAVSCADLCLSVEIKAMEDGIFGERYSARESRLKNKIVNRQLDFVAISGE
jgi:hypothetical protein